MNKAQNIEFTFQEGMTTNYLTAIHNTFGGNLEGNKYLLTMGKYHIDMSYYPLFPDFEILLSQSLYPQNIIAHRTPQNKEDFIHIHLFLQGAVWHQVDGNKNELNTKKNVGVYIFNGNFPSTSSVPADTQLKVIGFKFTKQAFLRLIPEGSEIINSLFQKSEAPYYYTSLPVELRNQIEMVFAATHKQLGRKVLIMTAALEVFVTLLNSIQNKLSKDQLQGLHRDDYSKIIALSEKLKANLDQKIKVEELATELGFSLSKLKRDFKAIFRTSVYQYYTNAKMDKAYHMLQSGEYSVTQIAFDLGYENQSKFSHMFKKINGINPSEVLPRT